jgi:hypothetical protein
MSITNHILAAQIRLKEANPQLETNAVLKLNPIEVASLAYAIKELIAPALQAQIREENVADAEGLRELLGQLLDIQDKLDEAVTKVVIDLKRARAAL